MKAVGLRKKGGGSPGLFYGELSLHRVSFPDVDAPLGVTGLSLEKLGV